jgi:hypothetical protein
MGVTSEAELDETCETWRGIINDPDDETEVRRRQRITSLVEDKMWPSLGRWKDYSWQSGLSQGSPSSATETAADGDCDDDDDAATNKLTGKL